MEEPKEPDFIFVYGTLLAAGRHPMHSLLTTGCIFFSSGYFHGQLYEIAGYPGAIESAEPGDKVFGELYRIIARSVLLDLDRYEECLPHYPEPREYLRKSITIHAEDGNPVSAWVYIYNRAVDPLKRIESGRYLAIRTAGRML